MAKSTYQRYSKSLFGQNHQGYHSGAQVFATAATIGDFALNGLEGQIGIFLADGTLKSDALAAGDKFYVAQIRNGELRKSVEMTFGDGYLQTTKTPYSAAVLQQVAIGFNGTDGSLNFPTLAPVQEFVVSARNTTPGNQPFPVMEGRAVVRNLPATEYEIVSQIVADLMNSNDYEQNADNGFVTADIISDGAQSAIGVATLAVSNGSSSATYSAAHGLSVGDFVKIKGVVYEVVAVPTTTTVTLDRPYSGTSETALATGTDNATHGSAAYTDGTTELGILLTATSYDTTFVVSVGEDLAAADTTTITPWVQGSGEPWQVSQLEREGQVFDGFTTLNYPWVDDFGKPSDFVDPDGALVYDLWFLKYKKATASMAFAHEQAHHISWVVLSAPTTGDTPGGNFDTIFGT